MAALQRYLEVSEKDKVDETRKCRGQAAYSYLQMFWGRCTHGVLALSGKPQVLPHSGWHSRLYPDALVGSPGMPKKYSLVMGCWCGCRARMLGFMS